MFDYLKNSIRHVLIELGTRRPVEFRFFSYTKATQERLSQ